jgi:hypothetical protein
MNLHPLVQVRIAHSRLMLFDLQLGCRSYLVMTFVSLISRRTLNGPDFGV